jgi:hypothetical protein
MRRWLRLLPLLITALWLPLQAVAAIAMPFCRHAAGQAMQLDAAAEAHCHDHMAGDGGETPLPGHAAVDQDCDGCELCHLASAGYLLPAAAVAASVTAVRDFVARPVLASPSFIPEPPQHPPRRLS